MDKLRIPELTAPPVASKTIEKIGHDPVQRKLYVKFHRSGLYTYDDFNDNHYKKLLQATSFGTFVAKEVIPNHFCTKISDEQQLGS